MKRQSNIPRAGKGQKLRTNTEMIASPKLESPFAARASAKGMHCTAVLL
jgi:hypothetical protein